MVSACSRVHLRDATVVLLRLHHLAALVLQIEEDNHFAHSVVLCGALSHSLLEVPIPAQYLTSNQSLTCLCILGVDSGQQHTMKTLVLTYSGSGATTGTKYKLCHQNDSLLRIWYTTVMKTSLRLVACLGLQRSPGTARTIKGDEGRPCHTSKFSIPCYC